MMVTLSLPFDKRRPDAGKWEPSAAKRRIQRAEANFERKNTKMGSDVVMSRICKKNY